MKKTQIRERLTMQQLDISHIEQFNELLRYAFQVTDSDLLEFGWNNEEIKTLQISYFAECECARLV